MSLNTSAALWGGLQDAIVRADQALIRRVQPAVEACQSQIREVIT